MNPHQKFKIADKYIPFEIQAEIVKWLPVKILIRFTSVSKAWNSLIRSSNFIRDCHAIPHRLLIRYVSQGVNNLVQEKYVSIVDNVTCNEQKLPVIIPMPVKQIYSPMMVCISHGLFCLYDSFSPQSQPHTKRAVIWNPSIGKSVDIYIPDVLDTPSRCKTVICFWVCPRTSDAKLVKITLPMPMDTISKRVEVFTSKSGLWRSPRSKSLPRQSVMFKHKQVVIDEFIYWLAEKEKIVDGRLQNHYAIISFDMISEKFVKLHLPESITRSGSCLCISKLKGSLVVAATSGYNLPVWIMQNGDPKSFTPIFTINSPNTPIRYLLGFTESGEPIIVMETEWNEDELFIYEPNSKQIKSTGIFGTLNSFSVCSYA